LPQLKFNALITLDNFVLRHPGGRKNGVEERAIALVVFFEHGLASIDQEKEVVVLCT
jgi:hypothetical protein